MKISDEMSRAASDAYDDRIAMCVKFGRPSYHVPDAWKAAIEAVATMILEEAAIDLVLPVGLPDPPACGQWQTFSPCRQLADQLLERGEISFAAFPFADDLVIDGRDDRVAGALGLQHPVHHQVAGRRLRVVLLY